MLIFSYIFGDFVSQQPIHMSILWKKSNTCYSSQITCYAHNYYSAVLCYKI